MPEGLGTGIGEALHAVAQNLRARENIRLVQRQKQADDLVEQMHAIRDNIAKVGLDSDQGKQYAQQLKDTIEKHNSLYGAHETPLLMQRVAGLFSHGQKAPQAQTVGAPAPIPGSQFVGQQTLAPPGPAPRVEHRNFATEMAQAPVSTWQVDKEAAIPFKADGGIVYRAEVNPTTQQRRWQPVSGVTPRDIDPESIKVQRASGMTDEEIAEAARIKAGLDAKATAPKPLKFEYHPQTGGLTSISDPNSGNTYDASNIDKAPPEIKSRFQAIQAQQEQQNRKKLEEEDRRNREAEDRQQRSFTHALTMQTQAFQNALDRKDYGDAKKVVTDADTEYEAAVDRQRTMDDNLKSAIEKKDQQAMLSLIANHIGMTLGAQKGARINRAVWDEAIASTPWLSKIAAKFDDRGYLSGVTLAPEQMRQMVDLAHEKVAILGEHRDRVRSQYEDVLSLNKPSGSKEKGAAPAVDSKDPLGILTPSKPKK